MELKDVYEKMLECDIEKKIIIERVYPIMNDSEPLHLIFSSSDCGSNLSI